MNGVPAVNTSIVRVLSTDYGVSFATAASDEAVPYSPVALQGEDIASQVAHFQIPTANRLAVVDQHALIGAAELGGSGQVFEVDLGESETSRVCGISGNPIRLGWNILGNDWQDCFRVPFTPPTCSPPLRPSAR